VAVRCSTFMTTAQIYNTIKHCDWRPSNRREQYFMLHYTRWYHAVLICNNNSIDVVIIIIVILMIIIYYNNCYFLLIAAATFNINNNNNLMMIDRRTPHAAAAAVAVVIWTAHYSITRSRFEHSRRTTNPWLSIDVCGYLSATYRTTHTHIYFLPISHEYNMMGNFDEKILLS